MRNDPTGTPVPFLRYVDINHQQVLIDYSVPAQKNHLWSPSIWKIRARTFRKFFGKILQAGKRIVVQLFQG